ncbi:MAG: ComF family protein [Anaerolineales bacterium]|nr:ComF family protein [Anaerolineales bacterium]HEY61266.1 ComF family protein [Anaerolineae bacterium]
MKYKRDLGLGDIFSNYLYNLFQEFNWQIDIIIPVPLSKQRFAERGYNQSALLARPLAWGLNIRYDSKAISRNRDTLSQVGLNIIQRRENVKGAFTAIKHRVIDKNILLIDDVITSGATIEACSQALIEVGAKSVYGLTLARAVLTK